MTKATLSQNPRASLDKSDSQIISDFRKTSLGILGALGLQFLLGIISNLFITIPKNHPGAHPSNYFGGIFSALGWALTSGLVGLLLHTVVALLLTVGSIVLVIRALQSKRGGWITVSVVGFLGILTATFTGISFVMYGNDLSSLIMSIGFLVAMGAYIFGLTL